MLRTIDTIHVREVETIYGTALWRFFSTDYRLDVRFPTRYQLAIVKPGNGWRQTTRAVLDAEEKLAAQGIIDPLYYVMRTTLTGRILYLDDRRCRWEGQTAHYAILFDDKRRVKATIATMNWKDKCTITAYNREGKRRIRNVCDTPLHCAAIAEEMVLC